VGKIFYESPSAANVKNKSTRLTRWGPPLALAAAVVFIVSSAFPVIAGLARDMRTFSKWWGILDVSIAFVLVILAFAIMALATPSVSKETEEMSYRIYRVLIHGIFVMLLVFFLFGNHITWINCITGFAWRAWLLLYGLPAWLTALKALGR